MDFEEIDQLLLAINLNSIFEKFYFDYNQPEINHCFHAHQIQITKSISVLNRTHQCQNDLFYLVSENICD